MTTRQATNYAGSQWQTTQRRGALLRDCWRLLRRINLVVWTIYAALVVLAFVLMRWLGEKNLFFGCAIYWPPMVWFLPAIVLAGTSVVLVDWKTFSANVILCITLAVFGIGWKWPHEIDLQKTNPGGNTEITILTNNRGQNMGQSMKPFIDAVQPDVMCFQDSHGMKKRYLSDPGYAAYPHVAEAGEFVVLSKLPILSSELISQTPLPPSGLPEDQNWRPVIAAKFRIDAGGWVFVLYNVHTFTPRGTLRHNMRGALFYGILGVPGTSWAEKRRLGEAAWHQRIDQLKDLLASAAEETEPVILAGDFNMPQLGYLHGVVAEQFPDSHEEAGGGFGFTFPGSTEGPLSLLSLDGAWMRLDYVFFDRTNWRCEWSCAEPDRASQHRALVARLALD